MERSLTWFVSRIALIIFAYIILYFGFTGLTSNYREGDSINYHIPLAEAFLSGQIRNPNLFEAERFLKFSPGVNEGILAGILAVQIPINTFNILGLIVLFLVCFYTAKRFDLDRDLSTVFAGSIVTLHTMLRWANTQIIDIWLGVWFVLVLGILQKPEKSIRYFLFLGLASGMLIGSKYTGPIFLLILFIFYGKKLLKFLNLQRIIAYIIPFGLVGLSWYLRNYLVMGNPFYPQGFLWFKDGGFTILNTNVWRATLLFPNGIMNFINALISEYGLWAVSIFTPVLLFSKKVRNANYVPLILTGSFCFIVFLFLPSDRFYNIAVSVFRYSYPVFITFILAIFLIARKFGKEKILVIFALANMLIIPELHYRPKFLILLLPVVFLVFYEDEIRKFTSGKVLGVNKK